LVGLGNSTLVHLSGDHPPLKPAAGISRGRGICRTPISWTTALFGRHRFCEL
jgi:hypothetical protein